RPASRGYDPAVRWPSSQHLGIRTQGAALHLDQSARPGWSGGRRLRAETRIGQRCQRLQLFPFIALEAQLRRLAERSMPAPVGRVLEPVLALCVQVGIVQKGPAIEEALSHIADRAFHLAFSLG